MERWWGIRAIVSPMARIPRELAAACGWGVAAGSLLGWAEAFAERYPQVGLHWLTLHLWAEAAWIYLAVSLAGGLAAVAVRVWAQAIGSRLGPWGRDLALLPPSLFVSLPTWVCVALRDRWLLPADRSLAIATLLLLALVHTGVSWVLLRRRPPTGRDKPFRRRLAPAALSLGLVAGLVVADRILPWLRGSAGRSNLLLVVLDTVRSDRLSSYGYARRTTPEIDAFAADAIRFTSFFATSSWTLPSHASLFTGLFPIRHGATQGNLHLARRFPTLAEILRNEGYRTWAASGNPLVSRGTNLAQGFEEFVGTWRDAASKGSRPPSAETHPAVLAFERFLRESAGARPFFAFVNLMEPHAPYVAPPEYRRRFLRAGVSPRQAFRLAFASWKQHFTRKPYSESELAIVSDLYDAELAYTSRIFSELLAALRRDGRFDDTWIVLTSDHGEHFGENGLVQHVFTLYNTVVHVPLVVRPPGGVSGGRTDSRTGQLVDLFPALLAALDVDPRSFRHHGVDLLGADADRDLVFSESYYPVWLLSLLTRKELEAGRERIDPHRRTLRALQVEGARFIWSSDGRHELYDVRNDPGETRNLYDPQAPSPLALQLMTSLEAAVEAYGGDAGRALASLTRSRPGRKELSELDAETREALRSLGYAR